MTRHNQSAGQAEAENAVSWLSTHSRLRYNRQIDEGFDAALKDFDVKADCDFFYVDEPRLAELRSVDWFGGTTPEVDHVADECVTFRMIVPAEIEFTTRFEFFETKSSDAEESLGCKILKTRRLLRFRISMTTALIVRELPGPDIKAFEVTRPALTALYGRIDPFKEYVQKRT